MAMKVQTTEQITRPVKYKKNDDDLRKPPEPEYTIFTQDQHSLRLDETANVQQFSPKLRIQTIKQWIDQTKASKVPFEQRSNISTWSDSLAPHSDFDQLSIAVSDTIEDQWKQREFDRLYGKIVQKHELQQDIGKVQCHKINEKVKRYKKAFLKGFFESRIRRIEGNKWLYDKLHVNTEIIKEKYHRLVYTSEPLYHTAPECDLTQPDQPHDQAANKGVDADKNSISDHNDDLESVYSFVPERDNVLLQDVNAPPHVRGFGKDKLNKYNSNIKLLSLDTWVPPDIQEWINEKKAKPEDDEEPKPDPNEKYKNLYKENIQALPKPQKHTVENWKYEQIKGVSELPEWLGPKLLDAKPELDLENFRKISEIDIDEERDIQEDKRDVPDKEADDDKASHVSKAESEKDIQQRLLRQLIQSQSREYYKLWYNTHDTFNTTFFLEARLQRLLQEVLGKKEWSIYCSYLKNKHEHEHEHSKKTPKKWSCS